MTWTVLFIAVAFGTAVPTAPGLSDHLRGDAYEQMPDDAMVDGSLKGTRSADQQDTAGPQRYDTGDAITAESLDAARDNTRPPATSSLPARPSRAAQIR